MSVLHVLRHTEPEGNAGLCYGQSDLPLTAQALLDLRCHVERLNLPSDLRIYSSPSQRCRLLAENLKARVCVDARLMEMNFGHWEAALWADLPREEVDAWLGDFLNVGPPAGESLKALAARLFEFLQELEESEQAIALVTHSTLLRLLLLWDQPFDASSFFREKIGFGAYRTFSLAEIRRVRKPLGLAF